MILVEYTMEKDGSAWRIKICNMWPALNAGDVHLYYIPVNEQEKTKGRNHTGPWAIVNISSHLFGIEFVKSYRSSKAHIYLIQLL